MNRVGLGATALVAVASAVACGLPGTPGILGVIGALLLVCALPGYAVVTLMFPAGALGALERLTLSLGLSLAFAAVGGAALHVTAGGIRADNWAALLGGITVLACGAAALRGRRFGAIAVPRGTSRSRSVQELLVPAAAFAFAAVLTVGAMLLSGMSARDLNTPAFTQLWMLPTETPDELVIGIRNADQMPVEGRLVVSLGATTREEWQQLRIDPGDTLELVLDVSDVAQSDDPPSSPSCTD